jgi:hypothetical protein
MVMGRRVRLSAMAVVVLAIAAVSAVDEEAVALNGNAGWVSDLGESDEIPPTAMSSSTSFAGMKNSITVSYSLNSGGKTAALEELQGEKLMGESSDDEGDASRVGFDALQDSLEKGSDMAGKISRMAAIKIIMSMPASGSAMQTSALELMQVEAGATWGGRRRNSSWAAKTKKLLAKVKRRTVKAVVKPVKKIVKKVVKSIKTKRGPPMNALEKARAMAEKAVNMAREKSGKARKKAAAEAVAAAKEASDKKQLELAEKRRHELTSKDEKRREKLMKKESEKGAKKAKEAAKKAAELRAAVARADEASKKESVVERKAKKKLNAKLRVKHMVPIHQAKEKAAKRTKEMVQKKVREVKAKFRGEQLPKQQAERQLKAKHAEKRKKAMEKAGKRVKELATKTAREAKEKNKEEKALKLKNEKRMKRVVERTKKAEVMNKEEAKTELKKKLSREKQLKRAAQRRIAEERRAKKQKRDAVLRAMEITRKKTLEVNKKADEEQRQKLKAETATKRENEKREKKAREASSKKAKEIARKVTGELKGKTLAEKQAKAYKEKQHKEKRDKAHERVKKMLAGLKNYDEKLAKVKAQLKEKSAKYNPWKPKEKKLKLVASNLSKIAKELAEKIKGVKGTPKVPAKKNVCNLAGNLSKLKGKGVLSGKSGKCNVVCTLKPSDQGLATTCQLTGEGKKCKKFLYVRGQSVHSAIMSEFDSYKQCKPAGGKSLGESGDVETLGEGAMPPPMEEGVEVGSFMFALKAHQDENGSVNVGDAIDLLMKCNKDGDDDLGASKMELGKEEFFSKLPPKCRASAVAASLKAIQAQPSPKTSIKCQAGDKVEYNSYTAACNGAGQVKAFIAASEQFHRQVIATFYSWKAECAKFH